MLFDAKRARVWTLEGLIAWLEEQDPWQTYEYAEPDKCAVAEYLKAKGEKNFILRSGELTALGWNGVAFGTGLDDMDRTYGAALKRARKALATLS